MLWIKENDTNLYVDFLANVKYTVELKKIHIKKNNELSVIARTKGNQKYGQNDMDAAMAFYNQSICLAESDSEYITLAYSNRSQCFLKMKKFEECLKDVSLAEDGDHSKTLPSKLEQRKQKCLEMLNINDQPTTHQPTSITFEAGSDFPCMSSAIKIDQNQRYERFITAIRDIAIEETLMVEETYIRVLDSTQFNECTSCSKRDMNFIPCINCADVMFCSEQCKKNHFHDWECDMLVDYNCCDGQSLPLILRSIIIGKIIYKFNFSLTFIFVLRYSGINPFETTIEMMKFIENCLSTDPYEISRSIASPKEKYFVFFKLSSVLPQKLIFDYKKTAYIIFTAIMRSQKMSEKFQHIAAQRFLMHLIVHHCLVIRKNAFADSSSDECMVFGESISNDLSGLNQNLDLITSYFNHSCLPNVVRLDKDNMTIIKAISTIKKRRTAF